MIKQRIVSTLDPIRRPFMLTPARFSIIFMLMLLAAAAAAEKPATGCNSVIAPVDPLTPPLFPFRARRTGRALPRSGRGANSSAQGIRNANGARQCPAAADDAYQTVTFSPDAGASAQDYTPAVTASASRRSISGSGGPGRA
jgi:hypothetical protein